MIKANELHLGNWVDLFDSETGHNFVQATYSLLNAGNFIDPIPLTSEILEKCQLSKNKYGFYHFSNERYVIIKMANAFTLFLNKIESAPKMMELITGFNYLHQFQNLYFALTGEELEIKL